MFPLTEQQRNHLAATLDQVDETLLEVIEAATPAGGRQVPDRFLRHRFRDIPPEIVPTLYTSAHRIRARLGDDIRRLALRIEAESTARHLAAYLSAAVVLLQDSRSAAMRAYGDVDPALGAALDPWLGALEADLTALRRTVETPAPGGVATARRVR